MVLDVLDLVALRVTLDLGKNGINLLLLQVDDVVHQSLSAADMLSEEVEVKGSMVCEWILDVPIEIDRQQATAVVRAERDLSTGIGRDGLKAKVCIAVGDRLLEDGVPKEDARLGTLPRIVDDPAPELARLDDLGVLRISLAVDREAKGKVLVVTDCLHKVVCDANRDVGACHGSLLHLGIDKVSDIRVLDGAGEHKSATTTILCHLSRRVGEALHKGDKPGGSEGGVTNQ